MTTLGSSSRSTAQLVAIWSALPIAVLFILWAFLTGLNLSFWHDEAWTIINYVEPGPAAIFAGEYVPNNHMLFSLLAWLTTNFGEVTEIAARFWSVVPSLAIVAISFQWIRNRLGLATASAFLVLVAANPLVVLVARQARGYGLAMLMTGLMVGAAWHALSEDSLPRSLIWVGVPAALAIFTLPIAVLPFLALMPLLYARHRRSAIWMMFGVAVSSLAWYLGNLSELLTSIGQRFGEQLPWYGFLTGPFETLLFPTARLVLPGYIDPFRPPADTLSPWMLTSVLVFGAFTILGVRRLTKRATRLQATAVWLPIFATFLVLTVTRVWVMDRFVTLLAIPLIGLVAAGIAEAGRIAVDRFDLQSAGWLIGAFVGLLLLSLTVPTYQRLTSVPVEAFKAAAAVAAQGGGPVLTNSLRITALEYYLAREPEVLDQDSLAAVACASLDKEFVLIDQPLLQTKPLDTACLTEAGYDPVRLPQLIRGDRLDVWIIDGK